MTVITPPPVTVHHVGFDYSWEHPDPAALKASGATFVARYLSPDPTKNITRAEADLLAAQGISVVSNFESTATEAENGYAAGVADARLALEQATAAGMPSGRPIYFSVDEDTTVGPHITAYFQGVASVLGLAATGGYGDYTIVRQLLDAGLISWAWETYGMSGNPTQWDLRVHIRQVQNDLIIGGAHVDLDQGMAEDIGQWTAGDEFVMDAQAQAAFAEQAAAITKLSEQIAFLTSADGQRFTSEDQAAAAIEAKLAQIAQGITDSYANLSKVLEGLPAAVAAAVVKDLPAGSQVDAAALENALEQAMRAALSGATVAATLTLPTAPAAAPAPATVAA